MTLGHLIERISQDYSKNPPVFTLYRYFYTLGFSQPIWWRIGSCRLEELADSLVSYFGFSCDLSLKEIEEGRFYAQSEYGSHILIQTKPSEEFRVIVSEEPQFCQDFKIERRRREDVASE